MTDLYRDRSFADRLSSYLQLFQKESNTYSFRCPYCGDSRKNKLKKRGVLYASDDGLRFYCHNCNESAKFSKFLRHVAPGLYDEYALDGLNRSNKSRSSTLHREIRPKVLERRFKISLPLLSTLDPSHFTRQYVAARKIPERYLDELYYADDFAEFIEKTAPRIDKKAPHDQRIIIPLRDETGRLTGVSARALSKRAEQRYIVIKFTDHPKMFGADKIDRDKTIRVLEGAIDAMFLDNCVATLDSHLVRMVRVLGLDRDYLFIHDNQPRNEQVVNEVKKTIDRGFKVFIPPSGLEDRGKDINDLVLSGLSIRDIYDIIDARTYRGLEAEMEWSNWKKT